MDKIIISELVIETIIGEHAWERQVKQKIILDIELYTDITAAASSDNIESAIDYVTVSKETSKFVGVQQCKLIETLADKTAKFILHHFSIEGLRLTLAKPSALDIAKCVAVSIKRMK